MEDPNAGFEQRRIQRPCGEAGIPVIAVLGDDEVDANTSERGITQCLDDRFVGYEVGCHDTDRSLGRHDTTEERVRQSVSS